MLLLSDFSIHSDGGSRFRVHIGITQAILCLDATSSGALVYYNESGMLLEQEKCLKVPQFSCAAKIESDCTKLSPTMK